MANILIADKYQRVIDLISFRLQRRGAFGSAGKRPAGTAEACRNSKKRP